MATIRRTPPETPKWQLTISETERGYLLAALDFARVYLEKSKDSVTASSQWPHAANHYQREIGSLEMVIASANPQDLSHG